MSMAAATQALGEEKHGEQPVSLSVHLPAAVSGQARPDERTIIGEYLRVEAFSQAPQQSGRALDIGEEKRERLHRHSLKGFALMDRGGLMVSAPATGAGGRR